MPAQSGPSAAALSARRAALSARHSSASSADRVLADALREAHAAAAAARQRLDAIADEIERCVANQAELAVDSALGAREIQRFLIAKHRELIGIVTEARRDAAAKRALLDSLRDRYADPASPVTLLAGNEFE